MDGCQMYYEHAFKQVRDNVNKYRTYGPLELLFENWKDKEWGKYMSEYFIPTFQPCLNEQRKSFKNK